MIPDHSLGDTTSDLGDTTTDLGDTATDLGDTTTDLGDTATASQSYCLGRLVILLLPDDGT